MAISIECVEGSWAGGVGFVGHEAGEGMFGLLGLLVSWWAETFPIRFDVGDFGNSDVLGDLLDWGGTELLEAPTEAVMGWVVVIRDLGLVDTEGWVQRGA